MSKKTVIAFYVGSNEGILKCWSCKVSKDIDMIDVSVPANTIFSFFSTSENVGLEIVQIKLLSNITVDMSVFKKYIVNQTVFCYGENKNGVLVVRGENKKFELKNFIWKILVQGMNIVYI